MANLPETPDYPAGVYQLETSDPVLGGPGGIANRQAEQLANRTSWLKAKVDAFIDGTVAVFKATKLATARTLSISGAGSGSASFDGSANANIALTLADSGAVAGTYPKVTVNAKGIVTGGAALAAGDIPADLALAGAPSAPTAVAGSNTSQLANTAFVQAALAALVDSSPIALNTLNELAAALGDDPNFATTMANLLAGKAPLVSPVLSGNPTGPTASQFNSDQSLATTEFVQRALGCFSGMGPASGVLTAADVGKRLVASGGSVTLPLASSVAPGSAISFWVYGGGPLTINCQGAETLQVGGGAAPKTTIKVSSGTEVTLVAESNLWEVSGTGNLANSLDFGSSLALNGYKKNPDPSSPTGFIIEQWGIASIGTVGVYVTFPIEFPNAVLHLSGSPVASSVGGAGNPAFSPGNLAGMTIYPWGTGNYACRWRAFGY